MSFKELLIKEYEDRSIKLEKQIDEYNLLFEKKKNEFENIDNEINSKSSEIRKKKIEIDELNANIIKIKSELMSLDNPSEPLYIIAYPDNSVTIVKENQLEEVNTIELKEFNKLIDNLEIAKAVTKLTKDEYKELLKKEDYTNRPLDKKYYKSPDSGIYFAQFHFRGILLEEYKEYKEGKIPLWKTLVNHSVHVDHRSKFNKRKELLQFVLTEDSIDSYLRVMKGERDPDTNNIAKALIIIKPSAEPKRIIREKNKKDILLDSRDAKKASEYIIEELSYWISPGDVGATANTYSYMATIVTGKVQTGILRSDYKELFTQPDERNPTKNRELFKGRWIFKAFKKPRFLWWGWEAVKTPESGNPYCECDQGDYVLHPADKLSKFKKEDYDEWIKRKENCK